MSKSPTRKAKRSWRDVLSIYPAADLFPMMTPDELVALGEDIKTNGLTNPITLWVADPDADLGATVLEDTVLLDGRNWFAALEAVGIDPLERIKEFRVEKPPTDPDAFVLSANLHRRHLTGEQKRELIAKVLAAQPERSNRGIAELDEVDHKTVGGVREELEGRGEIPHVEKRQDSKGRHQPAQKAGPAINYRVPATAKDMLPPNPASAGSREARQQEKAERRASREVELAQRITALPAKKYGVILADPPSRFEPWSRETGMDAPRPTTTPR